MAIGFLDLANASRVQRILEREIKASEKKAKKAGARALRKSLASGRTAATRSITKVLNLKKKYVDRYVYVHKVNQEKLSGVLAASGRKIPVWHFMTEQQKKSEYKKQKYRTGKTGRALKRSAGVSVKIYRGKSKQVIPGAFMAPASGARGKLLTFRRTGQSRKPIEPVYAPDDLNEPFKKTLSVFEQKAAETFEKNLEAELKFIFGGK